MEVSSRFTTGKWFFTISLIAVGICGSGSQIMDRQPQLNILVITDDSSFDNSFDRDAFFEIFDSFANIQWTELSHPEVSDLFGSDRVHDYDAMVFYDMAEEVILTDEQKKNMLKFFKDGAPAVFLHHTLLSYREWDKFPDIIGGRFFNKSPLITEKGDTIQSDYKHEVQYSVSIADDQHPVVRGLEEDFEIVDETYNNYLVKDNVNVLLTTDHPSSGDIIGWTNTFGNSQIVYLMNGHSETAYENQDYRRLLHNAINWVASLND